MSSFPLSRPSRTCAVRDCDFTALPCQVALPNTTKPTATAEIQQRTTRGHFAKSVISWQPLASEAGKTTLRVPCGVVSQLHQTKDVIVPRWPSLASPTLDSHKGDFEIARCWRHDQIWLRAGWAQHSTIYVEHSYACRMLGVEQTRCMSYLSWSFTGLRLEGSASQNVKINMIEAVLPHVIDCPEAGV